MSFPTRAAWPRISEPSTTSSSSRSPAPTDVIERLAWHMDEPVRDLSAYGLLALSDLAAQEITVALSGQGADELFGGYRKHRVASLASTWHRMPSAVRAPLAAVGRRGPGEIRRLAVALQSPDPVSRLLASSGLLRPDLRDGLFAGALAEQADAARRAAARHLDGAAQATPLAALLHLDAQLGLVDDMLHYFDRASMAHSLEVRVPFLDHRLVETCARMPDSVKVRARETKHVLRMAAKGIVPDFVLEQAEARIPRASTRALARGGRRRDRGADVARARRPLRRDPRPIDRRAAHQGLAGRCRRSLGVPPRAGHARGLAFELPAASFAAARGDAVCAEPHERRAELRRRHPGAQRAAQPAAPRRCRFAPSGTARASG